MAKKKQIAPRRKNVPTARAGGVSAGNGWKRLVWVVVLVGVGAGMWFGAAEVWRLTNAAHLPDLPDLSAQPSAMVAHLRQADAAARKNPASAEAVGALGMAYHANIYNEEAMECYAIAAELDGNDWRWPYYTALIQEEYGASRAAAETLRRVVSLNGDYPQAWHRLGEALLKQGLYDEARDAYQRAYEARPQRELIASDQQRSRTFPISVYGAIGLARIALARQESAAVRQILEPVVKQHPTCGPALRLLGQAFQQMGYPDQGETYFGLASSYAPYVPPADPRLDALCRQSTSSTFLLKQMSLANRGKDRPWAEFLGRRAVQVNPGDGDAVTQYCRLLVESGRHGEAISLLQQRLRDVPDEAESVNRLGVIYAQLDQLDLGERHLLAALSLDPNLAEAHNNLGIIARRRGQFEKAEEFYLRSIELDPESSEAYRNMGNLFLDQNRLDEAAAQFVRATQVRPNDEAAWSSLAVLAIRQGRHDEAVEHYRSALRNMPISTVTMNNLAWLRATCRDAAVRDAAEAIDLATRANQATGWNNLSYLNTLAAAYAEAGQFERAVEIINQAMSLVTMSGDEQWLARLQNRRQAYVERRAWRE